MNSKRVQMQIHSHSQSQNVDNSSPEVNYQQLDHLSAHNIYRLQVAQQTLIVKVFHHQHAPLCHKEKNTLNKLTHPNIIQPLPQDPLSQRIQALFKKQVLMFPEIKRGSLLNWILHNGSLKEELAKFIIAEVIEGLSYAASQQERHPYLYVSNVLIEQDATPILCGWSGILQAKDSSDKLSFEGVGSMVLHMVTGRGATGQNGFRKLFPNLFTPKLIHKFWEQLQKTLKSLKKQSALSEGLKDFVGRLCLGKFDSWEEVKKDSWLTESRISKAEAEKELDEMERKSKQANLQRSQKMEQRRQCKLLCLSGKEVKCEGQSNRGGEFIIEEFKHTREQEQIQFIAKEDHHFPCFHRGLKTILAYLKAALKEAVQEGEDLVDPLLSLKEYSFSSQGNSIQLCCDFGWKEEYLEGIQPEVYSLGYSVSLSFSKEESGLFCGLSQAGSEDLGEDSIQRMTSWLHGVLASCSV